MAFFGRLFEGPAHQRRAGERVREIRNRRAAPPGYHTERTKPIDSYRTIWDSNAGQSRVQRMRGKTDKLKTERNLRRIVSGQSRRVGRVTPCAPLNRSQTARTE